MVIENDNELDKRDWSLVQKWLELSPNIVDKIQESDPERYDRIKFRVTEYAKAITAVERFTELDSVNLYDQSQGQFIATIIITVLGSFFYARAAYLLFSNLGVLALVASLLAGLGASFTVDWSITKSLTKRVRFLYNQRILKEEENRIKYKVSGKYHGSEISKLKQYFLYEKLSFIGTTEGVSEVRELPINIIIAIILNVIEYLSALFVINQIFSDLLEISLAFQMIIGLLPVALSWAAANIKSQSFGLIEYHQTVRKRYFRELSRIAGGDDPKSIKAQKLKDDRLDAGIQFLVKETIEKDVPTANAAEYLFDCEYFQEEKIISESQRDKELLELEQKYKEKEIEINNNWSAEINRKIGNISAEKKRQLDEIRRNPNLEAQRIQIDSLEKEWKSQDSDQIRQDIINACEAKRTEQLEEIAKYHEFDKQQIIDEYIPIINYCQEQYDEYYQKYQDECIKAAQANDNLDNLLKIERRYTQEA